MSSELNISLEPEGWEKFVEANPNDFPPNFVNRIARSAHVAGFLWAIRCCWQHYHAKDLPDYDDVYQCVWFLIDGDWIHSSNVEWDEKDLRVIVDEQDSYVPYEWSEIQSIRVQRDIPDPVGLFPPELEPKQEEKGGPL